MERRFLGADDQLSIASTSTPEAEFYTLLEDMKRRWFLWRLSWAWYDWSERSKVIEDCLPNAVVISAYNIRSYGNTNVLWPPR